VLSSLHVFMKSAIHCSTIQHSSLIVDDSGDAFESGLDMDREHNDES
jgi:hypothetical protein